jgi:pimeloyl-ACP methyl ester carboxylesterase
VSLGNGQLFDQTRRVYYDPLIHSGYSVVLYHPPQFGKSTGKRTLTSDFLAAEAVIQWLMQDQKVGERWIHVVGFSIGSGPVTELMTKYQFGSGTLIVPLGRMESVVKRMVGPLSYLVRTMVRERYEYDNTAKMGRLLTDRVAIYQSLQDQLMGDRPGREAEGMVRVWQEAAPGHQEEGYGPITIWRHGSRELRLINRDDDHMVDLFGRLQDQFL